MSAAQSPFFWICICFLWMGCTSQEQSVHEGSTQTAAATQTLFSRLSSKRTGIDFTNTLSEHPSPNRNILLFEYFANGAGVAVGDLNGDMLEDVFFTGNMSFSKLYLNKGDLVFDDVTSLSGVAGRVNTWKTGVAMADVNGDGRLDIYVCYSGDLPVDRRVDELYINQGNDAAGVPQFEEQAAAYGLANPHSSNQAYFFDFDRDGDLDLFLQTHNVISIPRLDVEGTKKQHAVEDTMSGVRFYRNDEGRFSDITIHTGISSSPLTYGLGASITDINKDGWMDIYVGNDYSAPDYLYINNGDGTFSDQLKDQIGHTSNASMGIDAADINNDGWPDLMVLDMLPESKPRQKTVFVPNNRTVFNETVLSGFHHQYLRNTLQLNNGNGTFSEIGLLAGVASTDWSWAPLIADLDNDGRKDLYVTNGVLHDMQDRDFLAFKANYVASKNRNLEPDDVAFLMSRVPAKPLKNYAFRNKGTLQFEDASAHWGLDQSLISTGAAYADLDNDGDLDLVTNNINEYASIFENHSDEVAANNYLQLVLEGDGENTAGIGAKATLYDGEIEQYLEQVPMRGYLSSVGSVLHFGLGQAKTIDSLEIVWPDGARQKMGTLDSNQRIVVRQADADSAPNRLIPDASPIFQRVPSPIRFTHEMTGNIDDFRRQPLLDHPQSFSGPALAAADVNGDGREDVFAGGGSGQASRLFIQQQNGRFVESRQRAIAADARSHDQYAVFFDADSDGDKDLYAGSGGYGVFEAEDDALQDRLYINDGSGNFSIKKDALPRMLTSTGVVAVHDVDGDGASDLFVGGRVIPGRYPEPPRSYVLMNDGKGNFQDRTAEIAPALLQPGMVSDARWHELNGDGSKELIIVGIWMPVSVFEMKNGLLVDNTDAYFDARYSGLWNSMFLEDLNQDGQADLVVGNLGLNTPMKANETHPAELVYADFNNDGSVDPMLSYATQGMRYLHVTLDELNVQMPAVTSQFSSYKAFAEVQLEDLFGDAMLADAQRLEARTLETSLFLGTASGQFRKIDLPIEAQFSPVLSITSMDYNEDGRQDLLLAGNLNEANIQFGKYDANYGVLLKGNGQGGFEYISQQKSGLRLQGDVWNALEINNTLLFGVNRDSFQAYRKSGG